MQGDVVNTTDPHFGHRLVTMRRRGREDTRSREKDKYSSERSFSLWITIRAILVFFVGAAKNAGESLR